MMPSEPVKEHINAEVYGSTVTQLLTVHGRILRNARLQSITTEARVQKSPNYLALKDMLIGL